MHRPSLGRAGDRDPEAATELEQPLVAKHTQRPQHRVRVDAENGGKILRRGKALSRLRLAFCDRASDLARDLLVMARAPGTRDEKMRGQWGVNTSSTTRARDEHEPQPPPCATHCSH